jgi:cytochrome c oxidase cbb3-type subunit III
VSEVEGRRRGRYAILRAVRVFGIASITLLFALGGAASCKARTSKPPVSVVTPAAIDFASASGKSLYLSLCAPCHGVDAKGYVADHAPSLSSSTFLESATDEYLAQSISMGRPGTSMAGYGKGLGGPLDNKAVNRIVAHLRGHGPSAKVLDNALGDPQRGAAVYATACRACHGDQSVRGEAVHLANPQFLRQATPAFLRYAIVHGRPDTKMVAFANTLTAPQIDDVVAFVRSFLQEAPAITLLPEPTGKEPLVINPKGKDPVFKLTDERFVGVEQVNQALKDHQRMIIIDARPAPEWRRVHIKGAVSIPYHDMKRLAEIPKDVWAIAYCACPHHLSGNVVDELIKQGHKRALVLDEGINVWHQRGFPVVSAPGVPMPVPEAKAAPRP